MESISNVLEREAGQDSSPAVAVVGVGVTAAISGLFVGVDASPIDGTNVGMPVAESPLVGASVVGGAFVGAPRSESPLVGAYVGSESTVVGAYVG